MRIGIKFDTAVPFGEAVEGLADYEACGVDLVGVSEAYTFDAVSQLGYLAARTRTMQLCSNIMQLYTRTPTLTAMTAAGLDLVSGGRFVLGLGASGPQVVEGFHGVAYDAPLARTRETIEICRAVWRREPLIYEGARYRIPLPPDEGTGLGKPLKLINHPVRERIPISLAAIGPKNVELAARFAESWQPLFFHPGRQREVWGDALDNGLAGRDAALGSLDVMAPVNFALGAVAETSMARIRDQMALYIGGMGARGSNFYNRLACRYGYGAAAAEIQNLYLAGRKADAARAVPEELIQEVSLLGEEVHLAERLADFAGAGVTTLLLNPLAPTPQRRIADVGALVRLVAAMQSLPV